MPTKKIAIIIPTFQEGQNLKILLNQILALKQNCTIIVVDDNSQDETKKIIKNLQKTYTNLKLISRNKKAGRGSAVLKGLDYALRHTACNYFVEMDADLSHPAKQIPQLAKLCNDHTVVIASRYINDGKNLVKSFGRQLLSHLANQLIRFYLRTQLSDNTNGFRCYPKPAVQVMLKHQYQTCGYIALSETLMLLKRYHFQFKEIPTIFIDRTFGKSNANFQEVLEAAKNFRLLKKI